MKTGGNARKTRSVGEVSENDQTRLHQNRETPATKKEGERESILCNLFSRNGGEQGVGLGICPSIWGGE